MSKFQISRNDFDALTLTEKLENFGSHFFDEDQMIVLHAVMQGKGNINQMCSRTYKMMMDEDTSYSMHCETFMLDWIVSEINEICENIIIKESFAGRGWNAEFYLNNSVLEDFFSFDLLVKAGLIEELEAEEEETEIETNKMRKQLKQSTRQTYNVKQLVNHLELYMSESFGFDPYRFSNVSADRALVFELDASINAYVHQGCFDKEDMNELIDQIYRTERMNEKRQTQATKKTS